MKTNNNTTINTLYSYYLLIKIYTIKNKYITHQKVIVSTIINKVGKDDTRLEEAQKKLSEEVAFELRHERKERMSHEGSEGITSKQAERQVQSSGGRNELTWFEEAIVATEEQRVGF